MVMINIIIVVVVMRTHLYCYTSSYILPLIKSTSKGDSRSKNLLIGLLAEIDSIHNFNKPLFIALLDQSCHVYIPVGVGSAYPVDDKIDVGILGMRVSSGKTTPSIVTAAIVSISSTASASVASTL